MKFLTEKGIVHKLIIAIVIVLLFNFMAPTISSAGIGGILFEPIQSLLLVIADGIMSLSQSFMFNMGSTGTFVTIQDPAADVPAIVGWGLGILAGVGVIVAIAAAPFTLGASLTIIAVGATGLLVGSAGAAAVTRMITTTIPLKFRLPIFILTPEAIFSNEIPALDVNFFESADAKGEKYNGDIEYDSDAQRYTITVQTSTGEIKQPLTTMALQPVISSWYYALRNFAIVALLIILVYIGIRIVISSAADDRAKYKQKLMDWLVAMCLLFFMHYIMVFAVTITEEITKALNSANVDYFIDVGDKNSKLKDYIYGDGAGEGNTGENIWTAPIADQFRDKQVIVENDGVEHFMWPTTLMGKARMELQLDYTLIDDGQQGQLSADDNEMREFGYTVIYLALVIYTMLFLFRYLKRLLMLTFLTIIAPLMAMTYPLDKIKDGNAQGFNMWLKEYMYNLLIQPVHLILYTVLIGSAIDLVADNLLYALVALGFILQGEKILRKFFGFDKASTVEGGSALGGALAMQGLNHMSRLLGGKKGKDKESGNNNSNNNKKALQRKADKDKDTDNLHLTSGSGEALERGSNTTSNSNNGEENAYTTSLESGNRGDNYGTYGDNPNGTPYTGGLGGPELTDGGGTLPGYDDVDSDDEDSDSGYDSVSYNDGGYDLGATVSGSGSSVRLSEGDESSHTEETDRTSQEVATAETESLPQGRRKTHAIRNGLNRAGARIAYRAPKIALATARAGIKYTAAGTGAMIGVAAGLVSDDYSNVLKMGAAGAGAGLLMGQGVSSIPSRIGGAAGRIRAENEALYAASHTKDEIDARNNERADKAWKKDAAVVKLYQDKLHVSKKEAKEIMENEAMEYRKHGITDDKIIIKAMKADDKQFGKGHVTDDKIMLAKMATKVGGDQRKLKYVKESLTKQGVNEKGIENYISAIKKMNDDDLI